MTPPSISEIECEQAAREPVATIKGEPVKDQDFMCLVGFIELAKEAGAPALAAEAAGNSLCGIYAEVTALRAAQAGEAAIDLDRAAWESIKKAASESPWIPPQYMMNDWAADVCGFLKGDRRP